MRVLFLGFILFLRFIFFFNWDPKKVHTSHVFIMSRIPLFIIYFLVGGKKANKKWAAFWAEFSTAQISLVAYMWGCVTYSSVFFIHRTLVIIRTSCNIHSEMKMYTYFRSQIMSGSLLFYVNGHYDHGPDWLFHYGFLKYKCSFTNIC